MEITSGTEVVFKRTIKKEAGDRPDYTGMTSKAVIATVGMGQEGYWASLYITLGPYESTIFAVEKGFTQEDEWVPEGKVFFLDEFSVTASDNVLIEIGVAAESKDGFAYIVGWTYGYGQASLYPRRAHAFGPNSRPLYIIKNYSDRTIEVNINVYGVMERLTI